MHIDIVTLFPRMLEGFLAESMLGRAQDSGAVRIGVHNLRDWSTDKHHTTDDRPFGGGPGMVLKPEPLFSAVEQLRRPGETTCILMTPDGERLGHDLVVRLSRAPHLLILSGHYEGVDQRVRDVLVDREISIGDYVLTNGTVAAAVLVDAVSRHLPGVLGEGQSLTDESFTDNLLDFPQYTRPAEFRGMAVPEVLLSGDHAAIQRWRTAQRLEKTRQRRPDLLQRHEADHR
jgi:tRNA (guanine37-N1)-methyltransferase